MIATPGQKYQFTIPQRKLCHVPGFSHSGEKQVCYHTHLPLIDGTTLSNYSKWLQRKTTCTHKNNPHLPEASKPKPKPRKACCGKLFPKDLPPPGQTLLPCLHPSSTPCTLVYGQHLLSHILRESLLSQQRWTSSREGSNSLRVPPSHLL